MNRSILFASMFSFLFLLPHCSMDPWAEDDSENSLNGAQSCSKCDGTEGETEETEAVETAEQRVLKALNANNISNIKTFFTDDEVLAQEALPGNEVDFERALRLALESFIYDGRAYESPLFVAHEDELEGGPCLAPLFGERIRCYLDQEDSILGLVHLDGAVREVELDGKTIRIYPPEEGETVAENWVFFLKLPQLSDHFQWAVVYRALVGSNAKTLVYNYGFN